jgi:hypothetical protein
MAADASDLLIFRILVKIISLFRKIAPGVWQNYPALNQGAYRDPHDTWVAGCDGPSRVAGQAMQASDDEIA